MKKVLIVDDERMNVAMLQFILKDKYVIITAENGRQGLAAVKEMAPDLIILDVHMPEMSGLEFLNALISLPDGRRTPVILLSADEDIQKLSICESVAGFFDKPVNVQKLEDKIKECLG